MWNLFNCYLSGRHEYGMWCEPGTIFLRCVHCGRRSPGWAMNEKIASRAHAPVHAKPANAQLHPTTVGSPRVAPMNHRVTG